MLQYLSCATLLDSTTTVGWTACLWQRGTKFGYQAEPIWPELVFALVQNKPVWTDPFNTESDVINVLALVEASHMNLQAALKYKS